MIIVSQNKTEILNFENINLIGIDLEGKIKARLDKEDIATLGKYETEERAKEVLDEIVNTRAITEIYKCSNDNTQDIFDKKC